MTKIASDTAAVATRSVTNRSNKETAAARCVCYSALSELVCSPHDVDTRESLREKIGVGATLDYATHLDALLDEFVRYDSDQLKRDYSGLFEVGSDGPPCPIREDLQTGQRSGTREDLVRFFNFFNYKLEEHFAWAPDHLSVELEFMHFLCYHETAANSDSDSDVLSYQLAQFDFSERHLVRWVPDLAARVATESDDSLYSRIVAGVSDFVMADFAWQSGTISTADEFKQ